MAKTSALGKGLESIFGADLDDVIEDIQTGKVETKNKAIEIQLSEIRPNPYQPRKVFDEKALHELADSIQEHGLFTPILVRKSMQGYEIIAGERRWRACKIAKLTKVLAIVMDFTDQQMMEISILENIQREDLNPIEEAVAFDKLMKRMDYTQEKLAKRLGKSRAYITNILRLLKLPTVVQDMVISKELSMGHVRPLITLADEEKIIELAEKVKKEHLSVREVEKLVKHLTTEKPQTKKEVAKDSNLQYVENLLEAKLQTRVVVTNKKIEIKYVNTKDLNRILELLQMLEQ